MKRLAVATHAALELRAVSPRPFMLLLSSVVQPVVQSAVCLRSVFGGQTALLQLWAKLVSAPIRADGRLGFAASDGGLGFTASDGGLGFTASDGGLGFAASDGGLGFAASDSLTQALFNHVVALLYGGPMVMNISSAMSGATRARILQHFAKVPLSNTTKHSAEYTARAVGQSVTHMVRQK